MRYVDQVARRWTGVAVPWLRGARARTVPWLWTLWQRPRRRLAAGGVLVLLGALLVWALWPAPPPPEAARARQYLAYTACLLTDDHGTQGPAAAPVWAGMQDASLATHAKVQFLAVTGPQTGENAAPFVASLAQSHCDLIFAAGGVPAAGVHRSAATFPKVRFYLVGETGPMANVTSVGGTSPEQVRASTAAIIEEAAKGRR